MTMSTEMAWAFERYSTGAIDLRSSAGETVRDAVEALLETVALAPTTPNLVLPTAALDVV